METYPFAAVLFDLDGVVIDSMPLHRAVWATFLRSYGCTPSSEELRRVDGRRAADVITLFLPGPLTADELTRLTAEQRRALQAESDHRTTLHRPRCRAVPRGVTGEGRPHCPGNECRFRQRRPCSPARRTGQNLRRSHHGRRCQRRQARPGGLPQGGRVGRRTTFSLPGRRGCSSRCSGGQGGRRRSALV